MYLVLCRAVDLVVCVALYLVCVCVFLCFVYLCISLCVCLSMWLLSPAGRWQDNLHEGKGERRDNSDLENFIRYTETEFLSDPSLIIGNACHSLTHSLTDSVTFSKLD